MTVLLLDTHVLLWWAADDPRLGARQRSAIADAERRYVGAASAYEIALKVRLGRLPGGRGVLDGWPRLMRGLRATELSLSVAHMARAGGLDWEHRDPFDRMLVAQAQLEGAVLLTDDARIRHFEDVRSTW
ncbi:type II toxin-antitoxin system VapC family toxin [Nocardioides stalactiti]|uniref:type II toxin-antitoxin system VapC family toxin n=1 Tax=Nocardioides stalactiti TaxID=2755356 RepID=UPI001601E76D|nr:type II toxin-antitoxin system VapC family toxin [Nocardioides stalactiti]